MKPAFRAVIEGQGTDEHYCREDCTSLILNIKMCSNTSLQNLHHPNILAEYQWEYGFNAVNRLSEHEVDIKNENTKNRVTKHLEIFHKENVENHDSFEYSSIVSESRSESSVRFRREWQLPNNV